MVEENRMIEVVPGIANDVDLAKYQAQTARIGDVHRIVQLAVKKLAVDEVRKVIEEAVIPRFTEVSKVATTALILQQTLLTKGVITDADIEEAVQKLVELGVIQKAPAEGQPTPS